MPAVVMSNPGLHLAVLGNPGRRKKASAKQRRARVRRRHKKSSEKENPMARRRRRGRRSLPRRADGRFKRGSNPRRRTARRTARRRYSRRNPVGQFVKIYTDLPKNIGATFRGNGALMNIALAGGAMLGTYALSGTVTGKVIAPIFKAVGMDSAGKTTARVLEIITPSLIALGATFIPGLSEKRKTAIITGGGVASIMAAIAPNQIREWITKLGIDKVAPDATEGGGAGFLAGMYGREMLAGMGAYVDTASYSGTQGMLGYEQAAAYAGTGQEMLAGGMGAYVSDASYSGTQGMGQEMLAGSFLEEASIFQPYM
jgi:hypothetical protein